LGLADPELTQLLVTEAYDTAIWVRDRGVRWELATVPPGVQTARRQASFVRTLREGPGLMEMLFSSTEQCGIEVCRWLAGACMWTMQHGYRLLQPLLKGHDLPFPCLLGALQYVL
jgi:hypothetical protein